MVDVVYDYVGSENVYGFDLIFLLLLNLFGLLYLCFDVW